MSTAALNPLPPVRSPDQTSAVLITLHRAGSSIHGRLLPLFAEAAGLVRVDHANDAKQSVLSPGAYLQLHKGQFANRGYFFGPIRAVHLDGLGAFAKNRLVVQVRDPRDCLCSWYFWKAFGVLNGASSAKRAAMEKDRIIAQKISIDDFVLEQAEMYESSFDSIAAVLDDHSDYLLLSYEDMILNKISWIEKQASYLGINVNDHARQKMLAMLDTKPPQEDPSAHRRQVLPGDHKRKLSQATIELLTARFERHLSRFGYL